MSPLRAIIADDEEPARRRLARLLCAEGLDVVGAAADGASAIQMASTMRPDLLFLDIAMPFGSGVDVAASLRPASPRVVFVTAYPEFAARAFELQAFDYILKPVSAERLRAVLARARPPHRALDGTSAVAVAGGLDRIGAKVRGRAEFMEVADIDWVQAEGNYVTLHSGARTITVRQTITVLALELDPRRFLRVHRSFIVNVDRIDRLEPHLRGDWTAILRDGTLVSVSRSYRHTVLQALGVHRHRRNGGHALAVVEDHR